jgi:surface protein
VLPDDCTNYAQKNYPGNYGKMTVLPEEFDASNVTSMSFMFASCSNLTTIPQLDTSNVTNMNGMFDSCSNLTTIPQLDTSKVTKMRRAFSNCQKLTTVPQLDISKVNDMSTMFSGCTNLTTIPQLDTSNVTSMYNMFYKCTSLPTVFPWAIDCTSITSIDNITSIFNSSSVKEVTFKNVNKDIKPQFTAANLGSQLTKINFV